MMIVPTFVGPSTIEGVGVFSAEAITSGTAVWTLDERFDQLFYLSEIEALPDVLKAFVERYGYPHMTRPGLTVVEFDNGRFMNHSESPNTDFTDPNIGWAVRDIAAGEELTCNYGEFDPGFVMQPGRAFVSEHLLTNAEIASSVR
ncbi:MAG: SET domain-containing protein-lysine N-methyltransferase [Pseudomonadota bacterium]|nr:SET domain-containing protein-lysine N-methyltransferase [Pseudomonadota bacterium]